MVFFHLSGPNLWSQLPMMEAFEHLQVYYKSQKKHHFSQTLAHVVLFLFTLLFWFNIQCFGKPNDLNPLYIYILFLNIYHTWLVVWSMFYFPFHIWDNPSHGLSYFSRRLLHHQPDTAWITINPCEPPKCQSSEDISWKLCAVSFLPLMFNSMVTGQNWQLYHGRVPWLSWPITNIGWINGNSRIQQIGGTVPYKTIFCGDIPSHRPYIW